MPRDLKRWTPRATPTRQALEGHFIRLEPLDPGRHGDGLYTQSTGADAAQRFRWLAEHAPHDRETLQGWLERASASTDPLFFAVIDRATGAVSGRQALMRIDTANGVIEIGNIYWGPAIARKRGATEAFYLTARHVFDDLGYRRFEWKCDSRNAASRRAALRFGFHFEGIFHQHMIVKNRSRDTAWYAMLDTQWPAVKSAFQGWLDPENFDRNGVNRRRLTDFMAASGHVLDDSGDG